MERRRNAILPMIMVVLMTVALCGCLGGEEGDGTFDGPPPPPEEWTELTCVDGHLTSPDQWFANVTVDYTWPEDRHRVDGIGFWDWFHPLGSPDGPYYQYFDVDGDGYVSGGDFVHFTNLTDFYYDNGFNMTSGGEWVGYFELTWDRDKPFNYLVLTDHVNGVVAEPGFWNADITLEVRTPDLRLGVHEFKLGYLSPDGVALPSLPMEYRDMDGDTWVSTGDVVMLREVTRGYDRCQVQFVYYTQLVGFSWMLLPGA
jgi:hypothetical protein